MLDIVMYQMSWCHIQQDCNTNTTVKSWISYNSERLYFTYKNKLANITHYSNGFRVSNALLSIDIIEAQCNHEDYWGFRVY